MGAGVSRPTASNCRLLLKSELEKPIWASVFTRVCTFDALHTLYTFREPIGQQYLKVAQRCGYRGFSQPRAIEDAFRVAYKDLVQQYPNYGEGRLTDPREWWTLLIHKAFNRAISGSRIPEDLPDQLYQHFSSGAAYRLYDDVKPMFQRFGKHRKVAFESLHPRSAQWTSIPVVGIITNSDPRAIQVLRDLGLRVGRVEPQRVLDGSASPGLFGKFQVIPSDWNPNNDIDFVCTSWEAGSEKPDEAIFEHAMALAEAVVEAMTEQYRTRTIGTVKSEWQHEMMQEFRESRSRLSWMHIGDDMEKDYHGALSWGAQAVFLKRHHRLTNKEAGELGTGRHVKHISNLGEVFG